MKIIDSRVLKKGKFVTLSAVTYTDRMGKSKQWQMVSRGEQPKCITGQTHHPDAVIIVPYHSREDKLVVIKEFRIPVGDYQYGFPAGLLDANENMVDAAGRELREETGLDLIRVYRESPVIFSSAGITDESIAVVFAEVEGTPSVCYSGDSEDIEIFLLHRQGVQELIQRRDIVFGARAWLIMDAYVRIGKDYLTGNESVVAR